MDRINKTVAVIGGGPAGIVSCKSCLESGLDVVVFEKNKDIGGVWSKSAGKTWDSLRANISVNLMVWSDFPYESSWHKEEFATRDEVNDYINRYYQHFGLQDSFRFNSNVTSVRPIHTVTTSKETKKWIVEWVDLITEESHIQTFDSVIIATGFYDQQKPANLPEIEKFTGSISYGRNYKNTKPFVNSKVLVVGDSYSGCEIANDLANDESVSVSQLIKKPSWCLKRFLPKPPGPNDEPNQPPKILPIDFVFFSRQGYDIEVSQFPTPESRNQIRNTWFSYLCTKQQELPLFKVDVPSEKTPNVFISDTYMDVVHEGKIHLEKEVVGIDGKTVKYASGETEEIDHIVLAHGYYYDVPYLDKGVLKDAEHNPNDRLVPLVLHKTIFHPTYDSLCFVGMYQNAMFSMTELQSRWVALVLSEQLPTPTKEEIAAGLEVERTIRASSEQFPHGEIIPFGDDIAKAIGVLPDLTTMKNQHLRKLIYENNASPAVFRLVGPYAKPELAMKILEASDKKYFSKNELSSDLII